MDYNDLSSEDFDALVTGELTHYAIWMESVLVEIVSRHFVVKSKRSDFERLLLRRDGLSFQDKIEVVRAMLPIFSNPSAASSLKKLLKEVETFKAQRNAFAHGLDVTPRKIKGGLHVEIVTRSGNAKTVVVTPSSHKIMIEHAGKLTDELISTTKLLFA